MDTPTLYITLIGPIAAVVVANAIIFLLVLRRLSRHQTEKKKITTDGNGPDHMWARNAKLSLSLVSLLGITWIFGLLMLGDAAIVLQYIFTILATLQGFAIFVCQCLLRPQVVYLWRVALGCVPGEEDESATLSFFSIRLFSRPGRRRNSERPLKSVNSQTSEGLEVYGNDASKA